MEKGIKAKDYFSCSICDCSDCPVSDCDYVKDAVEQKIKRTEHYDFTGYGMFEAKRKDNGETVQGMLIEYGGDCYIQTMLGSSKKNEDTFDERFGNLVLESCAYAVESDTVVQIKDVEDYLNYSSDFETRYHDVVDGE